MNYIYILKIPTFQRMQIIILRENAMLRVYMSVVLRTEIIYNNMQGNRIFLFHADSSRLYLILGKNEKKIFYKIVLR